MSLAWGCGSLSESVDEGRPSAASVLFVVVDTLRADHLGAYGYARATSLHIDTLATEGWVFDHHVSSASQTVPATLSMMLSMTPAEHGFRHVDYMDFAVRPPRYPQSFLFLSEVFADASYATAAFVGNPLLRESTGFSQGFDHFLYSAEDGDVLTDAAIAWLREQRTTNQPFFLYLHYMDVHWPYSPPGEFRDRFYRPEGGRLMYRNGPVVGVEQKDVQVAISLYDGGIAFVDAEIGRLVEELRSLGMGEDTLIVVTSDHGEEFLDHGGLGHGSTVYGELVRVPLVMAGPGVNERGRRIDHLTHHLDLAPTILSLVGLTQPETFRGSSLLEPPRAAFAEDGSWLAVHSGRRKLVLDRNTDFVQVFDLHDRLDRNPLREVATAKRLWQEVSAYRELRPVHREPEVESEKGWTRDDQDRLRALGYAE